MLALLCAGQGTLSSDMFRLTEGHPAAAPVFAEASTLLGNDPRELVRNGDDDHMRVNRTSQILVATAQLALHACLADILPREVAVAGYSVGEMAAWSIAGIWSPEDTLRLTDQRARAMDEAGGTNGQLAYVRGLDPVVVAALAYSHHCAISIINPGQLLVVGGDHDDIIAFCRTAEAAGAVRSAPIAVSIASHTPRLSSAVTPFRQAMEAVPIAKPKPGYRLLAGGSGDCIFRPTSAVPELAADVARTLDWDATLHALLELGPKAVLDLGPGHALADMVRSMGKNIPSRSTDDFNGIDGIVRWIYFHN